MLCSFFLNLYDNFLAIPIHFLQPLKLSNRQELWDKAWLRPKADGSVVCWRDAAEHFPHACVYTQVIELFKRDVVKTGFSTFILSIVSKSLYSFTLEATLSKNFKLQEKTNVEYRGKNPYLLLIAN